MFCAFDLELAEPLIQDENGPADKLGITCGAIYLETGAAQVFKPTRVMKGTRYPARMSPADCQILARALLSFHNNGWDVVTWNGLKFDFHVLAVECQNNDWFRRVANMALNHIDMMFAFYAYRGWLLKLVKATKAMKVGGKTEGVSGLEAVELWKGSLEDQKTVLRYCAQDSRITGKLYEAVIRDKTLLYMNSKGGISKWYLPDGEMPDVPTCIAHPPPNMSWWKGYTPIPRERFYEWTE